MNRAAPVPAASDLTGSTADVDRLRVALIRIARQIRTQSQWAISPTQVATLGTIIEHQPLTNREIADLERVKASTASKTVDALERAGMVARVADPNDRRCVQVTVTAAGHAFADEVRAAGRTWLADRIDALDAARVAALAEALPALEGLLAGDSD